MLLLNPKKETFEHLALPTRDLLLKTISFFENKGLAQIKEADHQCVWYSDFLDFVRKEKLFATFLTPTPYGENSAHWNSYHNCYLNEILGFYGLSYWYTWQVTILGLGPIWMSQNESIKQQTSQLLREGHIFAFGLSEKEHGADIYSSEMTLAATQEGSTYLAKGSKYYIGNGNKAAFVSIFGKISATNEYVFFVVKPSHEKYDCVQNVIHSQNYVAEIQLKDYPITEAEILVKGQEAWDSCLNTVNIGKFNLGWAAIGICTHAFYESLNHASHRKLFRHYVTDFPHIKQHFVESYIRLISMKLFSLRAVDYLRIASKEDRRYLLYNSIVKLKVTQEGENVIDLLWDIIAAKGFEKDTYFEMAARDIRALPKLEGTVHVNMVLILKFMANYFFKAKEYAEVLPQTTTCNDDFLFAQGSTRGLKKVTFHPYQKAYKAFDLPNCNIFKKQIFLLKLLLIIAKPKRNQIRDLDFLLTLGELFTLVVYGQLILENAKILSIEDILVEQILDVLICDFSKHALQLYLKTSSTFLQKIICKKMIRKPVANAKRFDEILAKHVYPLQDQY